MTGSTTTVAMNALIMTIDESGSQGIIENKTQDGELGRGESVDKAKEPVSEGR